MTAPADRSTDFDGHVIASDDGTTPAKHRNGSTPTKAKGGAPARNKNAVTTGLYSARIMAARRRKKDWREMADEAAAIIAQSGLGDDALGQRLGATLAELQFERRWLRDFCERRGRLDKTGALKPAYASMLGLLTKDCDEARRLIERLAELREASGDNRPREIRVVYGDGTLDAIPSDYVALDGLHCGKCGSLFEPNKSEPTATHAPASTTSVAAAMPAPRLERERVNEPPATRDKKPAPPPPSRDALRDGVFDPRTAEPHHGKAWRGW